MTSECGTTDVVPVGPPISTRSNSPLAMTRTASLDDRGMPAEAEVPIGDQILQGDARTAQAK